MTRILIGPARISMTAVSAGALVEFAFDVSSPDPIAGRPEWLYQVSYDIVATTSAPSNRAQQKPMLQTLLADRFGLVCHREARQGLLHGLTPGKQVKLVETSGTDESAEVSRFMPRLLVHDDGSTETVWTAGHASTSGLATWLSGWLAHPVVDETGSKDSSM
jgi:uncharacterized protein (TIGR03435 family)